MKIPSPRRLFRSRSKSMVGSIGGVDMRTPGRSSPSATDTVTRCRRASLICRIRSRPDPPGVDLRRFPDSRSPAAVVLLPIGTGTELCRFADVSPLP